MRVYGSAVKDVVVRGRNGLLCPEQPEPPRNQATSEAEVRQGRRQAEEAHEMSTQCCLLTTTSDSYYHEVSTPMAAETCQK